MATQVPCSRNLSVIQVYQGDFSKSEHDTFLKPFAEPDDLETEIIELLRDQA